MIQSEQMAALQQTERRMRPTSWPALPQQTNLLSKEYGTLNEFLVRFNPSQQITVRADTELCFFGDYPTLASIKASYGSNAPAMWLVPQLKDLSEYCGCKEKLSGTPLEECACVIAAEFYYLKISEIMLFFHRFKSAKYGRFYGTIDPLIIIQSLYEFLKERNAAIDRAEREKEAQMREDWKKDGISIEDWMIIKSIAAMYNSDYVVTEADYSRIQRLYREFHVNRPKKEK